MTLETLRRLLEAATEAPWDFEPDLKGLTWDVVADDPHAEGGVAVSALSTKEDAALIAAARNALPALIEAVEAAERLVSALRSVDWEWNHDDDCLVETDGDVSAPPCTCGLEKFLDAVGAQTEALAALSQPRHEGETT